MGTHAELMQRRAYYASLVHRQRRGLIWNDAAATVEPAAKRS